MSDTLTTARSRPTRDDRRDINFPNGKKLRPRVRIAEDVGVCEKTLARMNPPTTYVGGVAYCNPDDVLKIISDSLTQKNQPPKKRRRAP
jgi:hypothetical protein